MLSLQGTDMSARRHRPVARATTSLSCSPKIESITAVFQLDGFVRTTSHNLKSLHPTFVGNSAPARSRAERLRCFRPALYTTSSKLRLETGSYKHASPVRTIGVQFEAENNSELQTLPIAKVRSVQRRDFVLSKETE